MRTIVIRTVTLFMLKPVAGLPHHEESNFLVHKAKLLCTKSSGHISRIVLLSPVAEDHTI